MQRGDSRRVESWKEIAAYLQRTTRTVQRWERTEGLPVHRHVHQDQSSVYAFTDELDDWLNARTVSTTPQEISSPVNHSGHRSHIVRDARIRGRYLLSMRTAESILAAVREFQTAIACDPTDAVSYAELAEAYCTLSGNEIWSPEDGFTKARAAALQALAIDPQVAQAQVTLAMVHNMYDWDWASAEQRFLTAIRLDPACATAHHWLGLMYLNAGRPRDAREPLKRAALLDPLSPAIAANIGRPLLFLGRYDDAITHFQKAFDLDPSFWMAHLFISWAHAAAGRFDASVSAGRRAAKESGGIRVTSVALAEACARAGNHDEALGLVESALADRATRFLSPYRIARVHVALGRLDSAFAWLDRALVDRSIGSTTCLALDPALSSIRSDPRFQRYLRALTQPYISAGRVPDV